MNDTEAASGLRKYHLFYLTSIYLKKKKRILNYPSITLSTLYIFCSCHRVDSGTKSATSIKPELMTPSW
jgi:hypothetical protein